MNGSEPVSLVALFRELLETARRRVHRAVLRHQAVVAVDRALQAIVGAAAAYAVLRWTYLIAGWPVPVGWGAFGGLLAAAAVVPLAVTLVAAWRAVPRLTEAAERLDLGAFDHNRIATALDLLARDEPSEFSAAAIQDGLAHLQRLQNEMPHLEPVRPRWTRHTGLAAGFLAALLAAALCGEAGRTERPGPGSLAQATGAAARRASGLVPEEKPAADRPPEERTRSTEGNAGRQRQRAAAAARPEDRARNEATGGQSAGDAAGAASPANRSANTQGESTKTTANSEGRPGTPPRPGTPRPSRESRVADTGKPEAQQENSSVSQGASGGGAMTPVRNSSSGREQTAAGDQEQADSEEAAADENEASRQRGGIQPSLKDRNESPSRELGISGEEGPPGTGRGGPTPPKKSRGTASLVLGVPVPDFVKGRLGPGSTKVTHERVEPAAAPGDPTTPTAVPPRVVPEAPYRPFAIPAAYAALVRDYLVALHSGDQTAAPGAPATAPSQPPTE